MFKSTDGGGAWSAANTGLPDGTGVGALAMDRTTPTTLYAGTVDNGAFKSTDGGDTWNSASTGLGTGPTTAFAIDATTPTTLYAGTGYCVGGDAHGCFGAIFKSTDAAGTWNAVTTGLDDLPITALALDPTLPDTLYAALDVPYTGGGGVFEPSPTLLDRTMTVIPYAATDGFARLFKSTNAGGTWSPANTGLTTARLLAVAVDPSMPGILYAGTDAVGVFKSTYSGGTWSPANTGLPDGTGVGALAIDPTTPTTLYAGTVDGAFRSTNGGGSWSAFNTGLTSLAVNTLAPDPSTPGRIYAGTGGGGVFDIEQVLPFCAGDCGGTHTVVVTDIITLVNMALGDAQAACPNGVPSGAEVNVALIIQAVNNALSGCP